MRELNRPDHRTPVVLASEVQQDLDNHSLKDGDYLTSRNRPAAGAVHPSQWRTSLLLTSVSCPRTDAAAGTEPPGNPSPSAGPFPPGRARSSDSPPQVLPPVPHC